MPRRAAQRRRRARARTCCTRCGAYPPVTVPQYMFTTYRLSRRYPPDKEVLSDISLSFLPGAKIGVLGYNGAGKSTLLQIMAGLDGEFDGDAQLAPGATVGILQQEPALDPAKDVRGNIQ